jgi:hypothetical protein
MSIFTWTKIFNLLEIINTKFFLFFFIPTFFNPILGRIEKELGGLGGVETKFAFFHRTVAIAEGLWLRMLGFWGGLFGRLGALGIGCIWYFFLFSLWFFLKKWGYFIFCDEFHTTVFHIWKLAHSGYSFITMIIFCIVMRYLIFMIFG